jgi:hypothetical protein
VSRPTPIIAPRRPGPPPPGLQLIATLPADDTELPDPASLPTGVWYGYTDEPKQYVVTAHPAVPTGGYTSVIGSPIMMGPLANLAALEVAYPAASNLGLIAMLLSPLGWALAVDTGAPEWVASPVTVVGGASISVPLPAGAPPVGADLADLTAAYPPAGYTGQFGVGGVLTYYSDGTAWLLITWYSTLGGPNTWEIV